MVRFLKKEPDYDKLADEAVEQMKSLMAEASKRHRPNAVSDMEEEETSIKTLLTSLLMHAKSTAKEIQEFETDAKTRPVINAIRVLEDSLEAFLHTNKS